ncbi:unnamed protein product, partial [Meganyctiphanes norvegica]
RMMELGRTKTWKETLKVLTGSEYLDPEAVLEYFRPLEDWLRKWAKQNDEHIGWQHEEKAAYCQKYEKHEIEHDHINFHFYEKSRPCNESVNENMEMESRVSKLMQKLRSWNN